MLERLLAELLLWSLGACLAWGVAHQAAALLIDKFDEISRALAGM